MDLFLNKKLYGNIVYEKENASSSYWVTENWYNFNPKIVVQQSRDFKKQGFNYPGNEVNHHKFFFATNSPYKKWPGQFKSYDRKQLESAVDNYFSVLEQTFNYSSEGIISNEFLFIDDRVLVENLIKYVRQYFQKVKAYLYIREPVDYYRSLQQQKIKSRSYINSPFQFKYGFKSVIQTWETLCELTVVEYNKGSDTCKDFCNRSGVDFEQLDKVSKRIKTSAYLEQMLLLEKIQKHLDGVKAKSLYLLHFHPQYKLRP